MNCRLHPSARDFIQLKGQGKNVPLLLAAPYLSESLVEQCREQGISCLDLNGRLYLRHRGLLVDRASKEKRFRGAEPEPALFAAKSSRVARALLSSPKAGWTQLELAAQTRCSTALVSRLMGEYVRLGWTDHVENRWRLVKPDALLDAWAGSDRWSKRGTIQQYSTLERDPLRLAGQVTELLGEFRGEPNEHFAFTQWFAASRRHPYTELPVVSAYGRLLPQREELKTFGWREVANGGRVWLILPPDEGVFQFKQKDERFPLVCDAQIYLDLMQVGLRGPDAARALRAWKGFRHQDP